MRHFPSVESTCTERATRGLVSSLLPVAGCGERNARCCGGTGEGDSFENSRPSHSLTHSEGDTMMNYRTVLGGEESEESEETLRTSQVAAKSAVCCASVLPYPTTHPVLHVPLGSGHPEDRFRCRRGHRSIRSSPSWRRRVPWSTPGGRSERTRVTRSRGERSGGSEILFSLNCSRSVCLSVGLMFLRHSSLAVG